MTLQAKKLELAFRSWFTRSQDITNVEQAADRFADVYHEYALDAEDVSGDTVNNLDASKFRGELDFSKTHTSQEFAQQLDNAFAAYWTGTTFDIGQLPAGTGACPNTGVFAVELDSSVTEVSTQQLYTELLPILQTPSSSAETKALQLSIAMDNVTKYAVTVIINGEDAGSNPVSNTCTVF